MKRNRITVNFLLDNKFIKKQTRNNTNIFWLKVGHLEIYIHEAKSDLNWNLGITLSGDDVNIRNFKYVDELMDLIKVLKG